MTKYELEKENKARRVILRHNIEELSEKLNEARDICAVIRGTDFETQSERRVVQSEIRRLEEFIEDEEKAYKETFEDGAVADKIADRLNI